MHRWAIAIALVMAACGGGGGRAASPASTERATTVPVTTVPGTTAPVPPTPSVPRPAADAFVRVAVATLWRSPSSPRAVDAPALRAPVDVRGWLGAMSNAEKRDLAGRVDSQALLGDRVRVVAVQGDWAQVLLAGQATPKNAGGYPGWIPIRQLTAATPVPSETVATVISRTSWLYDGDRKSTEVSMATALPVISAAGGWVTVSSPDHVQLRIAAADVSVTAPGQPAVAPSAGDIVRVAQGFTGLPYLWGGTSGFGFDCSGLTYLDYRIHGIAIPRDAEVQASAGAAEPRSSLQPGDLLFFATNGLVHHVGIYAGSGRMVQSPQTGGVVETVPSDSPAFARQYAGARRFV